MQIRTIYVADDGEEFLSMEECQQHEESATSLAKIVCLNQKGERMVLTPDNIEDVFAVRFASREEYELFYDYSQKAHCSWPLMPSTKNSGYYYFEIEEDMWGDLSIAVSSLEEKLNKLKKFLKNLG
jgi:arginyl-tRNA--protein-N-Asp/Glu arginylyltransferase